MEPTDIEMMERAGKANRRQMWSTFIDGANVLNGIFQMIVGTATGHVGQMLFGVALFAWGGVSHTLTLRQNTRIHKKVMDAVRRTP